MQIGRNAAGWSADWSTRAYAPPPPARIARKVTDEVRPEARTRFPAILSGDDLGHSAATEVVASLRFAA